jgi:hypothetical protein
VFRNSGNDPAVGNAPNFRDFADQFPAIEAAAGIVIFADPQPIHLTA